MSTTVTTGKVRFSYLQVFEAKAIGGKGEPMRSVSLIISKEDKATLSRVRAAIDEAIELGKGKKFGGKIPKKLRNPLRDGDEEKEDEAYEAAFFITAKNKNKVGVVDADLNPIIDQTEAYSGCYGRANITFFPYEFEGTYGIGCSLNMIQVLEPGEPLGGAIITAESAFGTKDEMW
jgi:hypothetical protein